jgi:hypothetical protein
LAFAKHVELSEGNAYVHFQAIKGSLYAGLIIFMVFTKVKNIHAGVGG